MTKKPLTLAAELRLRPATMSDARMLHAWRNDECTRLASRSAAQIDWQTHVDWLTRTLASPERTIRIAEESGRQVGVVRAERGPNGWELSWTVAPEARGRRIGARMVKLFADSLDGRITAVIRRGHSASERIAAAAGLAQRGPAHAGFDLWTRP
jgi:RimJ/RimL family protein N-acetyltransferase